MAGMKQNTKMETSGTPTPDLPALVLIHGAGGDAALWDAQASRFQQETLVCRVVLPGHGGSEGRGECDIRSYAHHAADAIRGVLGSGRFVLMGHSMGGAVALDMAVSGMEGLSGLVLVATGARLEVAPLVLRLIREDFEAFLQTIDRAALGEEAPGEARDKVVESLRRCPPEVVHGDFVACDRFDLRDRLHEVRVPTLVICGEEDRLTPIRLSESLARGIAGARVLAVPGAGHMVMLERPEAVNREVAEFLQGQRLIGKGGLHRRTASNKEENSTSSESGA